jgi:nicotinamidase-related amidase
MPTTLDPATALVLIDLQHGITALPTVDPSDQIVARGARLAEAFRAGNKLVVATRVAFAPDGGDVIKTRTAANGHAPTPASDWAKVHTELNVGNGDISITKRGWNAFYGTELDLELRRRKITGIVLAGISTSIGVESAARAANERGYELTIVTDAVTDTSERAHLNSLEVIFPLIAQLATTEEVLTALELLEPRRLPPRSARGSHLPAQDMPTPPPAGDASPLDPAPAFAMRSAPPATTPIKSNSEGKVT